MPRLMLNDQHWAKLKPIFVEQAIYDKPNLRLTIEAMLYRMRVGCPWRDTPPEEVTSGTVHDAQMALPLMAQVEDAQWVIADKGYNSQSIRDHIESTGRVSVIPRRKNSKTGSAGLDKYMYKLRHLVENMFARLKQFRAIATRYDKLKRNFVSLVALACAFIWLPM